jgi:signal transduction histidine kinase
LKKSHFGFFISNDNKPIFNLFLAKVFNSKAKETCKVTLSRDGNSPMYAQLQGIVTKNNEQCFLIAVDITERMRAELEIKLKNEELYAANSEKDKFFSIISHDLRGPFNAFLGFTKLMVEELPSLTQDEIHKMAGAMRDSAVNLFRLLENLLEWSRLQRGITSFEPGPFLLMPMIAESMHPVIDLANKKEIDIIFEIPADLEVFADQYMLASTIRNLASNAVKFTTKGGKVTIAANTPPGNSVEISVRDTGIGMSPQMVADLFRLDVQTNRKGTDGEPSSGLGLLLCKEFVEKHGGKLRVESEEGKGSVFYFTIPSNAEGLMKTVISNSVSDE